MLAPHRTGKEIVMLAIEIPESVVSNNQTQKGSK